MVRRSVSAHRRRAMSRRYEPPSADVTAIQNSALASSPIVEIHQHCVLNDQVDHARNTDRHRASRPFVTIGWPPESSTPAGRRGSAAASGEIRSEMDIGWTLALVHFPTD
jgi:hypothetical protein